MAVIEPFGHPMIKAYLKARDVRYLTDQDGDFLVQFAAEDAIDVGIQIRLMVTGEEQDIYSLAAIGDRQFRQPEWRDCILSCNEWNRDRRWPKAYFQERDDDRGLIVLDAHFLLGPGLHQELFNTFTDSVLAGAFQFWEWLLNEKEL